MDCFASLAMTMGGNRCPIATPLLRRPRSTPICCCAAVYSRSSCGKPPRIKSGATMRTVSTIGLAAILACLACMSARADETVNVGGSRAVLIKPNAPRASVILMPGGDGAIRAGDQGDIHGLMGNQLVRTRHAYAARGLAVLVVDV